MAKHYGSTSTEDMMDGSSKVHFQAEQIDKHDSEIVVRRESDTEYSVHLGFLQIHHSYEIRFHLPDKLAEDVVADPLQNLHVKVTHVEPSEDGLGHDFTLDFFAYKEKLMKEQLIVTDTNEEDVLLTFHARVLGKGKGTPALRTGIHCTGLNPEYDSEQSDWHGFD